MNGRKRILKYKAEYPDIYEFCINTQFNTEKENPSANPSVLCLSEWVSGNNWFSSKKLTNDQNLMLRGCIKKYGTSFKDVTDCLK